MSPSGSGLAYGADAVVIAQQPPRLSPAEIMAIAVKDLETDTDPRYRAQIRFLYCATEDERIAATYLLNAVKRARIAIRPRMCGGCLLRVDLAYLFDRQAPGQFKEYYNLWEGLADEDPYFHLRTTVVKPGEARTSDVTIEAGWVGLEAAARLRALSTSRGAVLRADYFIAKVGLEDYYDWAGVPQTINELFKQFGVDPKALARLAADTQANLLKSHVTDKNRRIILYPGPLGPVIFTLDVLVESPDKDPLRNPVDFKEQVFKFDASEVFAMRHGFWVTALYNAQGQRQAAVPAGIATDTTAPAGHQELRPFISCIRCHELNGGKQFIQPFVDNQYPLLKGPAGYIRSHVPELYVRSLELYDPATMQRALGRARDDYAETVRHVCGVDTVKAAQSLANVFTEFAYQPVTLATASREAGVTEEEFRQRTHPSQDPIILSLRAGNPVGRPAYEASFQEIMLLILGEPNALVPLRRPDPGVGAKPPG